MSRCPSELALERHLLDEAASSHAGHVAGCAACQARLAEMRALGDEFRREVFPATVDRVVEARPQRSLRRWAAWLAPFPLAAAAASMIYLVTVPHGPPDGYVGAKGGTFALAVYAGAADGAHPVGDGERVPAAAALRFAVAAPGPCHLWLLSVDATGQVSRLYPTGGDAPAQVAPGPLPGGAVLDGRQGPERLFAVCSEEPLAWADVERAARAAATGEAAVRAPRTLAVPGRAAQATVLLEKVP